LDGNDRIISIETADMGTGFPSWSGTNVPAWTSAQLDAIARILAWCHTEHGIPLKLIPNSAQSSRGIGYHRQGIDPWRCSTCERWSMATGKICPGDRRVAQIPQVIARAIAIVNGDEDMPTPEEIAAAVWRASTTDPVTDQAVRMVDIVERIRKDANTAATRAAAAAVWRATTTDPVTDQPAQMVTIVVRVRKDANTAATRPTADVDEVQLAADLAPLLSTTVSALDDAALAQIATAVADEQARRLTS
jgi:hypothetical protein